MELKQVKDFTNYYVGDDGFVYKDCGGSRGLKKLKGMPNSGGYRAVVLHQDGRQARYLVHRLVAMYFIPNPENKPYVDHIDTNPTNNAVENLRWVTPGENSNNHLTLEHCQTGQRRIYAKPIVCKKDGIEIRFDDQYTAEQYFNCDRGLILSAARRGETIYGFSVSQQELYEKLH